MWHYSPHRGTNNVEAWWTEECEVTASVIEQVLAQVANENGLELSHRKQRAYQSWDFLRQGRIVFAFQVARKARRVDNPVASPWGHPTGKRALFEEIVDDVSLDLATTLTEAELRSLFRL